MPRARGLWRAGVAAALGGSRGCSGVPGGSRGPLGGSWGVSGFPGGSLRESWGCSAVPSGFRGCSGGTAGLSGDPALLRARSPDLARRLRGLALVRGRFVSDAEAAELLREVEPGLRRGRYQNDHWDRAICGYRETEREVLGGAGRALLARVTPLFPPRSPPRARIHVLDLLPGGHVGPHVDSVKFCGCTIAGLSLLSPSVLRLRSLRDPQDWLELLLEPGSLYVLRGSARFDFTHEILPDQESFFGGLRVPRGRRVSLIFRNDPPEIPPDTLSDLPAFIGDPPELPQNEPPNKQ